MKDEFTSSTRQEKSGILITCKCLCFAHDCGADGNLSVYAPSNRYRQSYNSMQQLVDVMFPAFSDGSDGDNNAGAREFQDSSFSSYNYWKANPFLFEDLR